MGRDVWRGGWCRSSEATSARRCWCMEKDPTRRLWGLGLPVEMSAEPEGARFGNDHGWSTETTWLSALPRLGGGPFRELELAESAGEEYDEAHGPGQ